MEIKLRISGGKLSAYMERFLKFRLRLSVPYNHEHEQIKNCEGKKFVFESSHLWFPSEKGHSGNK
jgi:hypothetical protein